MKVLNVLWMFLLVIGVLSCNKKKYPAPVIIENSSVYYSRFTVDNTPFDLKAGVDDYYMYSSYQIDSNSIYGFVGELKQTNCSNCYNSLRIQINDYKVSSSSTGTKIDSSLHVGSYPILSGNPPYSYFVKFTASNNNAATYHWEFGDDTESFEQNPVKEYSKYGKYSVCLTSTANGNNYVSSICNKENIGKNAFMATISASEFSGNSINFNSTVSGGKTPNQYRYLWNFGNGITSEKNAETVNYTYRGSYPVTLRVVDNYGDTAYAVYNAKTLTDPSSSVTNYTISNLQEVAPPPPFSKIIITWTDANGVVYTSNDLSQPSGSSFEIVSVVENERNENNQTTKKIAAKFSCKLYNGSKSITIDNAEVVMCVAYAQ